MNYSERGLTGPLEKAGWWLGVVIAVFHIWVAWDPFVADYTRNALHFSGFVLLSVFVRGRRVSGNHLGFWVDVIMAVIVAAAVVHLVWAEDAIYDRGVRLALADWIAAGVVILGAIEFTRRVSGWVVPILILVSLSYISFWGAYAPGVFRFGGLSLETLAFRSIYGDDAIFGMISRISSTYVFVFIIFGAFLVRSGGGEFIIDLSRAIAGRFQGGPGLVAVVASGITGTISGSAVANTASTGVITIPMMKRAGFPAQFAGAVEASSSTGGQLMPPIMGAGAFIMAAYTQIPYETIAAVALLPALLYFASVMFFVRIEARKRNLQTLDPSEIITLREAFKRGGASFVIPIGVLIYLLIDGFTPTYAAVIATASTIASSYLTQRPMKFWDVLDALALGSKSMIMTAILLCAVGLIVNVITTAGIGNTFSLMISYWSGGSVIFAIMLIALASLILGMGLPVTAAYIVLATLSAPALAGMISDTAVVVSLAAGLDASILPVVTMMMPDFDPGMGLAELQTMWFALPAEMRIPIRNLVITPQQATFALLNAHMIIFWLSQDSNVTPPVCLAAFTGAAIAKSDPMRTGLTSWKLSKGLYIMPILFAYTPLLTGSFSEMMQVFLCAMVGIYLLAGAIEGCYERRVNPLTRVVAASIGVLALWPVPELAIIAALVGAGFIARNIYQAHHAEMVPAA